MIRRGKLQVDLYAGKSEVPIGAHSLHRRRDLLARADMGLKEAIEDA